MYCTLVCYTLLFFSFCFFCSLSCFCSLLVSREFTPIANPQQFVGSPNPRNVQFFFSIILLESSFDLTFTDASVSRRWMLSDCTPLSFFVAITSSFVVSDALFTVPPPASFLSCFRHFVKLRWEDCIFLSPCLLSWVFNVLHQRNFGTPFFPCWTPARRSFRWN